jgi:hypothetical protein
LRAAEQLPLHDELVSPRRMTRRGLTVARFVVTELAGAGIPQAT